MPIRQRLSAAFDAFRGKTPPPKADQYPYFTQFVTGMLGVPTINNVLSVQQLRAFSESPIPRRAIDYIRGQVSRLDWDIDIRDGKTLTRDQKRRLQAAKAVLQSPNPDDGFKSWIEQLIEDMLVIGWGISEIKPFPGHPDRPFVLYPIDSASIQTYLDWDGTPTGIRYRQFTVKGDHKDFRNNQLFVVKQTPRTNTPFGYSPLQAAVQQIQYFLDAQVYAGKTASNATPKKLLWMGQQIDEKKLQEFRLYFKHEIEGSAHIPITGAHDEPKSIELGLASDQALFLEWQKFLIAIIADAFGLDVMKFNITVGINRSTGDTLDDVSDESAIRPMAASIEEAINEHLLNYFGIADVCEFKFRFTTSFTDRKSLAVIHQIYMQADVLKVNEARRELGLPDLEDDPKTGKSMGDYTLSAYRALYGGQVNLNDAIGIDDITGHDGMLDIQKENADTSRAKVTQDPNNNGGNNGVHGAKTPKETAPNQHADKGLTL